MKSVIILWNMYYKQGPIFSTPRPMNFYKQNLLTIYNNMQVTMTLLETNFWYCGLWPDYSILKIFNSMIAGPRLCIMFIIIILIFQQLGGGIWTLNIYGKNTRRGQLIELQYLFFFFLFSFFFFFFCIKRDFIANWKYKTETSKSYKLQTTWLDNHRYKHIKLYDNSTTTKLCFGYALVMCNSEIKIRIREILYIHMSTFKFYIWKIIEFLSICVFS